MICLTSSAALAGGDFARGKVVAFSNDSGSYSFQFSPTERRSLLLTGCSEFNVKVEYKRVPWFGWLPFVHSSHPTKRQTETAASFLRAANQSGQEVYFGYMGYGLVPKASDCSFSSRGLDLEQSRGMQIVLSYHDLT